MVKFFKSVVFAFRFRKAVRRADKLAKADGQRRFVIVLAGRPYCVSRKKIRALAAQDTYRKGVKAEEILREAIYRTK